MSEPIKKLILSREYKSARMYTCPYCGHVAMPIDFVETEPWCPTGYRCEMCWEFVLPHRSMERDPPFSLETPRPATRGRND